VCLFNDGIVPFCLSVSEDRKARLWNLERHKLVQSAELPEGGTACAVSPSTQHFAVGTGGGSLIVFSRQLVRRIAQVSVAADESGDHSRDAVRCMAYSPNGALLAVGCDDALIRIMETRNYAIVELLPHRHSGPVTHLDWSKDSRLLRSNSCVQALALANTLTMVPRPCVNKLAVDSLQCSRDVQVQGDHSLPGSAEARTWGTLSCPLGEHTASLWASGFAPVSSTGIAVDGDIAAVLEDGALVSASGALLTNVRHRGAGSVFAAPRGMQLLSSGLYDGILFQFKLSSR